MAVATYSAEDGECSEIMFVEKSRIEIPEKINIESLGKILLRAECRKCNEKLGENEDTAEWGIQGKMYLTSNE